LNLLKRRRMRQWFSAALADESDTEKYAARCESAFDHGACFCLASAFQEDPERFEACLIEFVEGWERTRPVVGY